MAEARSTCSRNKKSVSKRFEAFQLRSVVGFSFSLVSGLPGTFTSKRLRPLDSREHAYGKLALALYGSNGMITEGDGCLRSLSLGADQVDVLLMQGKTDVR